uniref:Ig-like domain-containing protein n=1 Tax=Pyxicephalus adspersus TaxID=30357 RepID=A0AAV3A609_PYXAD|nr:TPA: hypothetical protein GDO54_017254 [Pyxicephalus adspersus]
MELQMFCLIFIYIVYSENSPCIVCLFTESHNLKYHFNAVSSTGTNLPLYSMVGIMDDTQFIHYNSTTGTLEPRYTWMEDHKNLQVLKGITQLAQKYEEEHTSSLLHINSILNQSNVYMGSRIDLHTYQIRFECELYDDGTIGGHTEFGYDGREFIFFDKHELKYIPTIHRAQILTQEWNRNQSVAQAEKEFAEQHCVDWINKYSEQIREEIRTKGSLEVKVWGRRQPEDVMRLHCLVYGFHPRAVDVKWMRNGVDHIPSDEMSPILPHPDGTYQIRVSVEVPAGEEDTFSCHVEHSSLEMETRIQLNLFSRTYIWPSVFSLLGVFVLAIFVGFFFKTRECCFITHFEVTLKS